MPPRTKRIISDAAAQSGTRQTAAREKPQSLQAVKAKNRARFAGGLPDSLFQ